MIELQKAAQYFNTRFYLNLDFVPIQIGTSTKTNGYYSNGIITLCPKEADVKALYVELVHNMVHRYQEMYGNPSRNGYHNAEWVEVMRYLGFLVDGTGQKVKVTPIEGGWFDRLYDKLPNKISVTQLEKYLTPAEGTYNAKTRYSCDNCGDLLWGKPTLKVKCGCGGTFVCE